MVCAEALFIGDKHDAGDLSYKVALRFTFFLEPDDAAKREEVFRQIRHAYSARSNIVHGNRRQKQVQKAIKLALDVLPETEDLLRRALTKYLALVAAHAQFIPNWDELVLFGY